VTLKAGFLFMHGYIESAENAAHSYLNLKKRDVKLSGRSVIIDSQTIDIKELFLGD